MKTNLIVSVCIDSLLTACNAQNAAYTAYETTRKTADLLIAYILIVCHVSGLQDGWQVAREALKISPAGKRMENLTEEEKQANKTYTRTRSRWDLLSRKLDTMRDQVELLYTPIPDGYELPENATQLEKTKYAEGLVVDMVATAKLLLDSKNKPAAKDNGNVKNVPAPAPADSGNVKNVPENPVQLDKPLDVVTKVDHDKLTDQYNALLTENENLKKENAGLLATIDSLRDKLATVQASLSKALVAEENASRKLAWYDKNGIDAVPVATLAEAPVPAPVPVPALPAKVQVTRTRSRNK